MLPDEWHLNEDVDDFLAQAGDFLCSRAALHNTPLTDIEKLRIHRRRAADHDGQAAVFGRLESQGEVRAIFYLTPRGRLGLTPLSVAQTDTLAARLVSLGHSPAHVIADHDTMRRLRRVVAAVHRRGHGDFLADASLPSRHAHPTAAATERPGAPHGRERPWASRELVP